MKRFLTPILALTLLTPLILAENSRAIAGQKCRGCSGKIRIRNINEGIHPVRGSSIHPVLGSTIHKPASWFTIAEASGRACASNATRCRKRARDAMIRMYKNIWEKDGLTPRTVPAVYGHQINQDGPLLGCAGQESILILSLIHSKTELKPQLVATREFQAMASISSTLNFLSMGTEDVMVENPGKVIFNFFPAT